MLSGPSLSSPSLQFTSDMSREELDDACAAIAARGGETGAIAQRILVVASQFDALIAKADTFLAKYGK